MSCLKPANYLCAIVTCTLLLTAISCAVENAPTSDEIAKITAAAPTKPRVVPAKPRRLLVFSRSWGYKHTAIPYGKKALEILGKKTGAFEAVITDDDSMFEPDKLTQFDAIFFNNTNNEIFLPENFKELPSPEQDKAKTRDQMLKKRFSNFISSGKGLAVIHAGIASFREWHEFGDIIGARFDNHPWEAGSTVILKVDEPSHPVAAAFRNPTFVVTDEVYQLKAPYSRDNVRVLLSIDTDKTTIGLNRISTVHRSDNDFAISYVKSYGKGRVFYCALGHEHELFWNPVILQHYLDGIQFVLGDLEADTTPSSKLKTRANNVK
jgi:type 1 glutamine amidotransferase